MSTIDILLTFKYPALFLLTIFEGPVTMAAVGFLFKLGQLSLIPAFITLLIADLAADLGWYALGYHGGHRFIKRFGRFFNLTEESSKKVHRVFHAHPNKILFLSKITMGFGFAIAVLFTAGMSKISFKKYLLVNALGGILWTSFMLFLGYTFGKAYEKVTNGLHLAGIIFFAVLFLLALRGFQQYMKRRFFKNQSSL